jgi:hypothetical protein
VALVRHGNGSLRQGAEANQTHDGSRLPNSNRAVVAAMSEDPPDNGDVPAWPESPFLIALWAELDAASDISVGANVLQHLDEVQAHCEAAIALIQRWKAQGPSAF